MFLSLRFRHPPHARQACARCALVMRGSNAGMRLRALLRLKPVGADAATHCCGEGTQKVKATGGRARPRLFCRIRLLS
jgi:hypothetical protein